LFDGLSVVGCRKAASDGTTGLVLPDRASSDLSREAGLNDVTLLCTGVPANRVASNTFMASFKNTVVKGNRVERSGTREGAGWLFWHPFERKREGQGLPKPAKMMSIGNEND
jgi:hypothetical protein